MNEKLAIVDVCWTLFYSNTTFDFVDFVVKKRSYRLWRFFSRIWLIRKCNSLIYKIYSFDLLRKITLRFLAGFSRNELSQFAENYFNTYLEPRKIAEIWQQLTQFERIVLASGTIDVVAEKVAEKVGTTDFFSSVLEYKNGICTGHLVKDFLQTKAELLSQIGDGDFVVITDNLADYQLIKKSSRAIILVYNNENRWRKLFNETSKITFVYAQNGARY